LTSGSTLWPWARFFTSLHVAFWASWWFPCIVLLEAWMWRAQMWYFVLIHFCCCYCGDRQPPPERN
jgi:hypothetical protein